MGSQPCLVIADGHRKGESGRLGKEVRSGASRVQRSVPSKTHVFVKKNLESYKGHAFSAAPLNLPMRYLVTLLPIDMTQDIIAKVCDLTIQVLSDCCEFFFMSAKSMSIRGDFNIKKIIIQLQFSTKILGRTSSSYVVQFSWMIDCFPNCCTGVDVALLCWAMLAG